MVCFGFWVLWVKSCEAGQAAQEGSGGQLCRGGNEHTRDNSEVCRGEKFLLKTKAAERVGIAERRGPWLALLQSSIHSWYLLI